VTQAIELPPTPRAERDHRNAPASPESAQPELWQLNLLRVGYLIVGAGLAIIKWPLLFTHGPWELKDGTVECMLIAMSLLALLGLRYPGRMLPILLFEVAWKTIWLAVIALPLWSDNKLTGATRDQAGTVLLVVIVIAVIPWRFVLTRFIATTGDPWRRPR
jgi:hypothetical protein